MQSHEPEGGYPARPESFNSHFQAPVTATPSRDTGPVINARTRQNHPCETLGDLAFYFHRHGTIDGIKVGVVSPESNILGSWIEAAEALPITVVQVYPERWHARTLPSATPRFYTSTDLDELSDTHILVTDCWPAEAKPEELSSYQSQLRFWRNGDQTPNSCRVHPFLAARKFPKAR